MGSRLTPLGIVAKWLVAPVAVISLGFFVVGPLLGQNAKRHLDAANKQESSPTTGPSRPATAQEPQVTVSSTHIPSAEPNVRVNVRPAAEQDTPDEEDTPKPVKKKHRSKKPVAPKPADENDPPATDPDVPINDPASNPGGDQKGPDGGTSNTQS